MNNTYEEAISAIEACFTDTECTIEEALENMQGLKSEVQEKIEHLQEDLAT